MVVGLLDGDVRQTLVEARRDLVECGRVLFRSERVERDADCLAVATRCGDEAIERLRDLKLVGRHRHARVGVRRNQQRASGALVQEPSTESLRRSDLIELAGDATTGRENRVALTVGELVAAIGHNVERAAEGGCAEDHDAVEVRGAGDFDERGIGSCQIEVANDGQSARRVTRREVAKDSKMTQGVNISEAKILQADQVCAKDLYMIV